MLEKGKRGCLPVPVGYTAICDARSDVEHDNSALTLNTI